MNDGGKCFVATAAFGDESSSEVAILRRYRDDTLAKTLLGRRFIRLYYKMGPKLSAVIAPRPRVKAVVRFLLKGIVACIERFDR